MNSLWGAPKLAGRLILVDMESLFFALEPVDAAPRPTPG